MADDDERTVPRPATILAARLWRARLVLAAAAVVLATFAVVGALSPAQALIGFAAIAAAALLAPARDGHSPYRRAAQEGLAAPRHASLLEAVLAGLPDPVIALDRDGRVVALNSHAHAVVPALRQGEPASLALRIPEVIDAIRRAAATGEAQRAEVMQRVPVDRWFEVFVTPVRLADAAMSDLVLMTFHDLTPLRRVEDMRADFVANASHELRTPLAALSGFIETLQGPARDDAAARQRFLAIMHVQATRMARLIDDLLSLSRIELNAHLRPQTQVDLVSVVRQVRDGLETLAAGNDVEVRIEGADAPVLVRGDRDELIRVFENLVENALKYGAAGKRVDIQFSRGEAPDGEPEVRVAVRDYGPGIAPEHLPRLTERFYRVDVAESRAQGGTGLGLALVKHILNRHAGRLGIDSIQGAGATLTVRLPLAPRAAPPVPEIPA
jgi:two-component system phosphate regulon sensor histidine kinase PhoR